MKKVLILLGTLLFLLSFTVYGGGTKESTEEGASAAETQTVSSTGLPSTPLRPWVYNTAQDYEAATGGTLKEFNEAPMLAAMVNSGDLPAVEERIPEDVLVVVPVESIGTYGGTIHYTEMEALPGWYVPAYWLEEPPVHLTPDGKNTYPNWMKNVEQSADDRTVTFSLRKGMKWSDGEPFTAEDILFWYEDIILNTELNPGENPIAHHGGSAAVARLIDDTTISFTFAAPIPGFANRHLVLPEYMWYFGFIVMPKHYLKEFHIDYNPKANELAKDAGFDDWTQLFNDKGGDGPYGHGPGRPTIEAWVLKDLTATHAVFERNAYYWKVDIAGNQLPYTDRLEVKTATNKESLMIDAVGGDTDFLLWTITLEDFPVLKTNEETGNYTLRTWSKFAGAAVVYFMYQTYTEPGLRDILRDVRFRRALSLAINRDEINELLFFGRATPMQAAVPAGSKYYVEEHTRAYAEFDPDAANKLLDEMGLKWNSDKSVRLRPDGKELTVMVEGYSQQETPVTATTELVKNYWDAIGVKTDFNFLDDSAFGARFNASQVPIPGHVLDMLPDLTYKGTLWAGGSWEWVTTEWTQAWYDGGRPSAAAAGMPEEMIQFFELQDEFRTVEAEADQIRIAKEIGDIWAEQLWVIGTVGGNVPHPCLVSNDLKNVAEVGLVTYFTFNHMVHIPAQYYLVR